MAGISLDKIEAMAPDQASLVAARKLVKPGSWSGLSSDDSTGLLWGECQGSGSSPYRVILSEADAGYKCSCPSRKFPCKHSLALMWMRAEGKTSFAAAQVPEWVKDWAGRRKPRNAAGSDKDAAPPAKSLAQARVETEEEADPKAQARAEAARERSRREREEAILSGLDDLDRWLVDQVDAGLGAFPAQAGKACRSIAQRLVDAKASGLASRLDSLPSRIYGVPEHLRATEALECLGQLHLLAEAYRRQDKLSDTLQADVRREIGWSQSRESLLSEAGTLCVSGEWWVVGTVSEVQPDRLRRLETWLWRAANDEDPSIAVLLDFVPIASGQTRGAYRTGERMDATLVFYPSARPLRALIKEIRHPTQQHGTRLALPQQNLSDALLAYEDALSSVPWIDTWPMRFRDARVRRNGDRLFLCSTPEVGIALPILSSQAASAAPLLAIENLDGFGLWDGHAFRLCFAQTTLGNWMSE